MKLSKAQSGWVKQLVEEPTTQEREELKRKEDAMTVAWCESTGEARLGRCPR